MRPNEPEYCDKCNKEVTPGSDACTIDEIAWDTPHARGGWPAHMFSLRRCIRCSPSRAQHIVHPDFEPVVDDRPEYDKRLMPKEERDTREKQMTQAWVEAQLKEVTRE